MLYCIPDLLIEVDTVSNHDNSIKDILAAVLKRDKLMGKPSYGVRLSAARAMLNKVTLPGTFLLSD